LKSNSDLLANALELAAKTHEGVKRKGTDIPYIVHPMEVAFILQENEADIDMICAGLLHDVLEDGKGSAKENSDKIREMTNEKVLYYVIGASEELKNRDKTNWETRKAHTIEYLANKDTDFKIKLISCADKLSNTRSSYRDLKNGEQNLWDRFNAGYEKQKWYYNSLVESLKDLKDYKMYQELEMLVSDIFNKKSHR